MLPNTAYIKMEDIWLVFCQLVPFSEVILLTAMEYQREDNTNDVDPILAVGEKLIKVKVAFEDEAGAGRTWLQWLYIIVGLKK